jgi:lipopolysaccharide export LptBFGC system permease protein LptF
MFAAGHIALLPAKKAHKKIRPPFNCFAECALALHHSTLQSNPTKLLFVVMPVALLFLFFVFW